MAPVGDWSAGVDEVLHLDRRARRVADDERARSPTAAAREQVVVRLLPTLGDRDPVVLELLPVVLPPVRSELGHGREEEGQTRRRRRRILDHEQALVLRLGEVVERLRDRQLTRGEVLAVEVQADVAAVDRRDPVVRIELVLRVDGGESRRLVGLEEVRVVGPTQQVVVDPEEHVALRVVAGEDRLVHDLDGVAALHQIDGDACLLLERLDHVVAHIERVVGDHPQRGAGQ